MWSRENLSSTITGPRFCRGLGFFLRRSRANWICRALSDFSKGSDSGRIFDEAPRGLGAPPRPLSGRRKCPTEPPQEVCVPAMARNAQKPTRELRNGFKVLGLPAKGQRTTPGGLPRLPP